MKNKWQYVWLFVFVIICLLSFGGSIIAENKKGPYRSSDEFLSDTVSSRAFHIDIAVVDNSKVYNHQIDVDQVSDIHTIKSTGNSTYVANYRTGDLPNWGYDISYSNGKGYGYLQSVRRSKRSDTGK